MRIAHYGTFDVANYGDLLFPLLLEERLRAAPRCGEESARGVEFFHISPRGSPATWEDCRSSLPAHENLSSRGYERAFDAVIVGGGHLIHALPTRLPDYQSPTALGLTAYAELWLGAAQLAARHGAKLIWNAPGVPGPFSASAARLLHWATERIDYLAVRDDASADYLRRAGVTAEIEVVPDTALGIARLWSDDDLDAAWREVFAARDRDVPQRALAVHVKQRYLDESPQRLAARLDKLAARLDTIVVLLALGPCHGDDVVVRRVASAMRSRPSLLDAPTSLRQVTACLARCDAYLGSSLHGLIVATAFGRPAWAVAREQPDGARKFSGFLRHVGATERFVPRWRDACVAVKGALSGQAATSIDCRGALAQLDAHWRKTARTLRKEVSPVTRATDYATRLAALEELLPNNTLLTSTQLGVIVSQAEAATEAIGRSQRLGVELAAAKRRELLLSDHMAALKQNLRESRQRVRLAEKDARQARGLLRRRERDLASLSGWLSALDDGFDALLESRRWRLGSRFVDIVNRLLRRPRVPLVTELLTDLFERHRRWLDRCEPQCVIPELGQHRRPTKALRADVVIPIHNATEAVRACLESVERCTDPRHWLILVDDASNPVTQSLLAQFAAKRANTVLLRNGQRQGYTHAANRGWRMAQGDYVVLLNSDTIVSSGWLDRLLACGESGDAIGLVGPLSNAASWQSIPERFDAAGDWAINELPDGWNTEDVAQCLAALALPSNPRVPLLNGYCLAIKRPVWERIGFFDEAAFPDGYGEETDYCLRARAEGFELAVATDAYVFHAKSRSYGHAGRRALTEQGQRTLRNRYGAEMLDLAVARMRDEPILAAIRQRLITAIGDGFSGATGGSSASAELTRTLADEPPAAPALASPLSVLFLLPVRGGGGGAHSVVQEAAGMRSLGVRANVAIEQRFAAEFRNHYPRWFEEGLFAAYQRTDELMLLAGAFDVCVATVYFSVRLLKRIASAHPTTMPAYYVQDYEPRFFRRFSRHWREARRSYGRVRGMVHFAKTAWMRDTLARRHGIPVHAVAASLDHEVYFPAANGRNGAAPLRIAAMVRPATPYRGASRTLRVLAVAKQRRPDDEVHVFGCDEAELRLTREGRAFPGISHGRLTREQVAALLRRCDVFVDLSDYQAFGRTGLEAMACGAAVILPRDGGVHEYAQHGENALLVDTHDEQACLSALETLLGNAALRRRFRDAGFHTAARYSIENSARSEIELFEREIARWRMRVRPAPTTLGATGGLSASAGLGSASCDKLALADEQPVAPVSQSPSSNSNARPRRLLRVHAVLPRTGVDWPGSSYIRLLLPLGHELLRDRLHLTFDDAQATVPRGIDVVLVQRTALRTLEDARALVRACRARGQRLIHELDDDLLALPPAHPDFRHYRRHRAAIECLLAEADCVAVPTETLATAIGTHARHVQVVPNALDEQLWFSELPARRRPQESDGAVRFLLMGTPTHGPDLGLIAPAARRLLAEFGDRVSFESVGFIPRGDTAAWRRTLRVPMSARSYPRFVRWLRSRCRWHIGLAPLADNGFNAAKSPLKYLDYAALGLAGLYSDRPAYSAAVRQLDTGLLMGDEPESWYDAMRMLVINEAFRRELAQTAYDDVRRKHRLAGVTQRWFDVLTGHDASPVLENAAGGDSVAEGLEPRR